MLVLDTQNEFNFANIRISLTDNTVISDDTTTPEPEVPQFNMLIPTVQDVGVTNTMELFYPGEPNRYLLSHGSPNALKFGFGPDLIYDIMNTPGSNIGVYTVNLRGPSATAANVICKVLYKVDTAVPYTDTDGNPYYLTPEGELTLEPTDNTPVVRDVLKLRYVTEAAPTIYKWSELYKYLNNLYSDVEDDQGYKCIPWFAVMYRGNTAYGNKSYFTMIPSRAEYDGNIYYTVRLFDGANSQVSSGNFSMDIASGKEYGTSYYIENMFNETFRNYKFLTADLSGDLTDLIGKYLYTLDDFLAGNQDTPSVSFSEVDPFNLNSFAVQVEMDSVDLNQANAFAFAGGSDGTETPDKLYEMFFNGEIIPDINSVLRYRINYVPDLGWNDATKLAIVNFMKKRVRMTVATFMVGGLDTMASALVDHQANWYETNPTLRQICRAQSPMMYNNWLRRMLTYPAGYFDTMALVNHFIRYTNYYQPFAGADARWTGFIEDTMTYAVEDTETINAFYNNRVNIVMKDGLSGAYLSEQAMNTQLVSDQTELNNAFLISNMLYDLVNLVHRNHYKFNETEEVRQFTESVDDSINRKYSQFAASMTVEVSRVGTTGRAKSANMIKVTIDMKDINKYTDINLILTDG